MINAHKLSQALFLLRKLCKPGQAMIEITRPEVESLWTVEVLTKPNSKQIKKLHDLGWYYSADDNTFSQYF